MKFNNCKVLVLALILSFLMSGCSTVQKAFDPQRKNSSEEFLVKKKSPLSMPPDFEELPLPKKQQNTDQDINDLKVLIGESIMNNSEVKNYEKTDLEKSIIYKIKNN
tara:strand:- start:6847 stop:7167 length:321 start_codon:yes stop_codon:yes gene_type:complete